MAQYLGRFDASGRFNAISEASDFSLQDLRGLQEWWRVNNCRVMAAGESGLRALGLNALANRQAAMRAQNGCYLDPPSGFVGEAGEPPMRGGQCPGTRYRVRITVRIDGGAPIPASTSAFGPLSGPAIESISTGNNREAVILRGFTSSGNLNVQQMISGTDNQRLSDLVVTSLEVTNGGPDDCGDQPFDDSVQYPPGKELPEPPSVGDEVAPKAPFDVDITINDIDVPITIEVGPGFFGGDKGTRVDVNGRPYDILPDGGVSVPDNGEEDLPPGVSLADKIEELQEELEKEISGSLSTILCDGEEVSASYSGTGLLGLQAMIETAFNLRTSSFLSLCAEGLEIGLGPPQLISSKPSVGVGEVDVIAISTSVRLCLLVVTGNPPGLRVFKLAGDQSEARFGFWSVVNVDGNEGYSEKPCEVFVRNSSLPCPNPYGLDRSVRISLKPGLGYSLFGMQEVS